VTGQGCLDQKFREEYQMIINHNMASLNTYRQMSINETNTSKSLQKLSSGLRINSAADDAAGLAISEKMRGQIRGLDQASRNAQDGISLVQTAEGALNETTSILQRMRELSVQSASDTNTSQDRSNIQTEVDQLGKEIDRIATTTQFNTKNLLDGSMGKAVAAAVASVDTNSAMLSTTAAATLLTGVADSNGNSLGILTSDSITISYVKNGALQTKSLAAGSILATSDIATLNTLIGGDFTLSFNAAGAMVATAGVAGESTAVYGISITVKDSSGNVKSAPTNALSSFTQTTAAANIRSDGSSTILIGANTGQMLSVDVNKMDSSALGVSNLKVDTQGAANVAIKVLDTALQSVSSERSKLGAFQNRLEHTIKNLGTSSENLTAAESRIRDVDMAKEMMNFQKNNILQQASQAMLAQANQQPQGVLQLLR
jgi:flagellin